MRTQNFVTRRRALALAVSFVFGLARVGVVDASPAAIHERPFASTLRVLIIDGDPDVRLLSELRIGHDDLEKRLAPFLKGSVPRYERSQREGLAKMQSGVYDLIVAPSHIIARATQSGYAVIAESQRQRRTAFVVPEAVTAVLSRWR